MNIQKSQGIKEYLQNQAVQKRVQRTIAEARSKATVTISQAAKLFEFSESQLREWEKKGLLTTDRTALSQDGKGHRQYTPYELSKLAALKELFNEGGYNPGDIPHDFDAIWSQIEQAQQNHAQRLSVQSVQTEPASLASISTMPIDHRVIHAEKEVFWRYFTSQVLRLSLMLICEDIPDVAGLILPLQKNELFVHDPNELYKAGESLIGWLSESRSYYTFLDVAPSFEVPSDFRIEALPETGEGSEQEDVAFQNAMIVVQRKARPLNLSKPLAQIVQRLLKALYCNIDQWKPAFDVGMRDYLYQSTDFAVRPDTIDVTLNSMTDMVVELGGKSTTSSAKKRWEFCCLLLPQDPSLPLQQRSLVVRAQSKLSPYKVGSGIVSSVNPGLSLRAYQSGSVVYRPEMPEKDSIIAYQDQEKANRSAIALPIPREDGLSIGVLYIASEEAYAFTIEDQRILRLIGTMMEELLLTYRARQKVSGNSNNLINHPEVVDPAFGSFLNENDFIQDVETLLTTIQEKEEGEYAEDEEVAFIAIDIDNQSILATKLGNRVARNLSQAVGLRIQERLSTLFTNPRHRRLYHMDADRYYLLLDGLTLTEARNNAERLRVALAGEYLINVHHASGEKPTLPENMLEVGNVTVRLGIPAYKFSKLRQILRRFDKVDDQTAVYETRTLITTALNQILKQGRRYGGNVIISWDYETWDYILWKSQ